MTPELSSALGKLLASGASGSALPLAAKWDKAGALKGEVAKLTAALLAQLADAKAADDARTNAANSLVVNERLVTKVYFPRIALPISTVIAGLVDFAIAFALSLVLMVYYRCIPSSAIVALPYFLLLAVGSAVAVGVGLSALNVRYRDVRYTLPFLTQVWLFATPIAYSSSLVPERWRALYGLNPMVSVVEGFRWGLLGAAPPVASTLFISSSVVIVSLFLGFRYFLRVERSLADVV
jgi:lipopolysaccharide transport system permease protein